MVVPNMYKKFTLQVIIIITEETRHNRYRGLAVSLAAQLH